VTGRQTERALGAAFMREPPRDNRLSASRAAHPTGAIRIGKRVRRRYCSAMT
jgi:hypothetical protein